MTVNIDSIHHCGIFGAESLTSLTRNVFGGEGRTRERESAYERGGDALRLA